jgi:hypothetical protein
MLMTYRFDEPFATSVGELYAVKSDHRNGSKQKSRWEVSPQEEVAVFERACKASWSSSSGEQAWGLHLIAGKPSALGSASSDPSSKERLWLAKFVRNALPVFWHGYPARYRRKKQDCPPVSVLQDWWSRGYIQKHEILKIRSCRPCSLSD